VLTGTDLYRDLPGSASARQSLQFADRIVVLNERALGDLSPALRRKSTAILQSANVLRRAAKKKDRLDCVVVGHLRPEKDPATLWRALEHIPQGLPISIRHIGAALQPGLAREAKAAARRDPRYRWTGPTNHGLAREAIRRAHLLIHPSILEGGANVIVEAITAGTPVLASRMSGNLGMLGADYPGYFDVGDAEGLAGRLVELCGNRRTLGALETACGKRMPLMRPAREAQALRRLVDSLLVHGRS
jgi:putative glycosyltransferase (TIGR04348 family)